MMMKVQELFEPSSPAYLHTHRDSKVLSQAYFPTLRKDVYVPVKARRLVNPRFYR